MDKVDRQKAESEVNSWLDKKKVFQSTRETNKDNIDLLVDAICEGVLTMDQEFEFTHKLLHPFGEQEQITHLTYKSRLNDKMLRPYLKGVKSDDGDSRLLAYIAALTGTPRAILEGMDSLDKKISMAIAVFFL